MATSPTSGICLKCNTPLVPGAAFCGTCGTPAGSPGRPPMPPPMPPRPQPHGARQVVLPMDQPQALHAASGALPRVNGEIVNQSPVQLAFRIGNFLNGRHTGTIDTFPEGPNRTALNVTLKPDYMSLVPAGIVLLVITLFLWVILAKSSVDSMYAPVDFNNPYAYQPRAPGIGAYIQWWMVLLFDGLVIGLVAFLLAGPMLDKRKNKLMTALQAMGGTPAGLPGTLNQGFGPQAGAALAPNIPAAPAPPQPATPFDQLRKLAELRDSGAISADDFERAKADILKKVA